MRLDINLATHPHEDARAFYFRASATLGAIALVTALLILITLRQWRNTRDISAELGQVQHQISQLDKEKAKSEEILNRPENRGTRDRSRFVNSLIAQKSFSWTQVFADLEKLMPTQVHLVSINPELKQNQISMRMVVGGTSREKAIDLLHNLENSRHFREPRELSEQTQVRPVAGQDTIQIEISAVYVPENVPVSEPGSAGGGEGGR
jgi:type IV pilus assembly protein PilN